ncbi:multicomponent Na+:H+ antiporter subunit G [Isoptericola halotolerans]|uniref:Multicomponent Na+:H+ antiporter subunit G n=1 Tax=Isoptericola halotolerans TaxID=300560 RepID=A0ABX2A3Y5_9MICO|nr:multicomponent Na+:H+ antiporter subunit G [Isoptericola halotolerans]
MLEIVGQVLIVLGALVFATAGLGVIKLPDVYTRISAISTAAGFGLMQIIVGAVLLLPGPENVVKAAIAVVLQLATSAVGGMALARSGYLVGSPLVEGTSPDQLAEDAADTADAEPRA